jgi:hypothetical protein
MERKFMDAKTPLNLVKGFKEETLPAQCHNISFVATVRNLYTQCGMRRIKIERSRKIKANQEI